MNSVASADTGNGRFSEACLGRVLIQMDKLKKKDKN